MRRARVCSHELWVPDSVADWDAVAEDSPWERERMESILNSLVYGDTLYDIGAEHGWMSAIYAQRVGGGNMALVEPSPDFWPNIKMCWQYNSLGTPLVSAEAFCGEAVKMPSAHVWGWPPSAVGVECGRMAYRHPNDHSEIPVVTIDWLAMITGRPPRGITIDVEGAELGVLAGAEQTLRDARPLVWCSVHPDLMIRDFDVTPDDLFQFMDYSGYSITWLRTDHEQHWLFTPR